MPKCPKCEDENPQLGAKCPRDGFYYVYDDAFDLAQSDPRIGTLLIDKYVIIGRISKGGMGAVYRALQLPVEREVAFKVLRAEMEGSDKSRDRFIREARAVSRLTHPNIITLYDFGFDENQHPYMVMEYAPGQDLSRWLRQDGLTIERILLVVRQLLSALDAAHAEGIVHRDLKPENMIVTETTRNQDQVKLLDFGIARMINETSTRGLTREGEVFGTPHYMAPEQAQGAKEVGPAADVYAVGVMLYELLTGEPPYDAPTPLAVLLMHINEPLPEVVARPGVMITPDILQLLHRATAKNVADRYASAAEMLVALDQILLQKGMTSTGSFGSIRAAAPADASAEALHPTLLNTPASSVSTETPVTLPASQSSDFSVAVHDPDPSTTYNKDELFRNSDTSPSLTGSMESQEFVAPSSNKNALIALVALVLLLALAGGTAIYLVSQSKSTEQNPTDTTVADTTTTTQEVKEDTTTPPAPKDDTSTTDTNTEESQKIGEVNHEPSSEDMGSTAEAKKDVTVDPTPKAEDTTPVADKPDTTTKDPVKVVDNKPKNDTKTKSATSTKSDSTSDKGTSTTAKKDPTPATSDSSTKKDTSKTVKKDTWGAPTKEQIEKFKKNDKW